MSNLAQNITARPSSRPPPSAARVKAPKARKPNPHCKPHPTIAGFTCHTMGCGNGWHCAKQIERIEDERPFAEPKIVTLLPYVLVAQLSKVHFEVFASETETPDVAALLASPPTTGCSRETAAAALVLARYRSNYASALRPLVERLMALLSKEQGARCVTRRVSPSAFCSWLRVLDADLRTAEETFHAGFTAIHDECVREGVSAYCPAGIATFDAVVILGHLTSAALRKGDIR